MYVQKRQKKENQSTNRESAISSEMSILVFCLEIILFGSLPPQMTS